MTSSVFDKTYRDYLSRLTQIDLTPLSGKLGIEIKNNAALIPLFDTLYHVSATGITDPSGKKPAPEINVVLCRYLLMCSDDVQTDAKFVDDWASFKDFKGAGPLTVFFKNDVERPIIEKFSGRKKALETACSHLNGIMPGQDYPYDVSMQIIALPKISLLILFNDTDKEFPSSCNILFSKTADRYLDAECLAILGALLSFNLCNILDHEKI